MEETLKSSTESKRQLCMWKVFGITMSLVAIGLLVALLVVTTQPSPGTAPEPSEKSGSRPVETCTKPCMSMNRVIPPDLDKPTVYQDLSAQELTAVVKYLFNQSDLKLVPVEHASVNSSYIFTIDLFIPMKNAILDHFDRQMPIPNRSAKAIVIRGDLDPPVVEEYIVSPLPIPVQHEHVPNGSYTQYPIPYGAGPWLMLESVTIQKLLHQMSVEIHDLLLESYGTGLYNCSEKCIAFEALAPVDIPGRGRGKVYIGIFNTEGAELHTIGTDVLVSTPGTDIAKWEIAHILYNYQMFNNSEELMNQYRAGNLTLIDYKYPNETEKKFSTFRRRGSDSAQGKKGPRMYQPDGPRYKVSGQYVEYMDWSFHFRVPPIYGVQLFDVKYKGQRIAYEISLQELTVFYSGYALNVVSSHFLDLSYLLTKFEMVKGIDCPLEASYFDAHHVLNGDKVSYRRNVVCIFEYNTGIPLMKHYANGFNGGFTFHGAVSDYVLTLRSTMSVYNYDYIVDFCFHNNGVVHVKFATTGYVITTFDSPNDRRYGFPILRKSLGPLHQHMANFKVDLDILGERNSFVVYDIKEENIRHPWFPEVNRTQTKFVRSQKTTEQEACVMYDFDIPQIYVVYSENSTNRYGSKRGYRIINQGMTKLLLKDEQAARFIRWGKYQLAVTKFKQLETASSSPYTLDEALYPIVDFDQFLEDDESIVNEDLVVWITMGVHHLPTSEDVPSVAIPGVTKSFYLKPFNYFDEDPSISSRDAVFIAHEMDDETVTKSFGRLDDTNCVPHKFGPLMYDGTW